MTNFPNTTWMTPDEYDAYVEQWNDAQAAQDDADADPGDWYLD